MTTRYLTRYPKSLERMTLCKCPKCGRLHKAKLYWTGNGTPKIFCHDCRFHSIVSEFYYEEPATVGPDARWAMG